MRVFITCSVPDARQILSTGFADWYDFGGRRGVWVGSRPLDVDDGFRGDVVLAVDVPDEVFTSRERIERPDDADGFRSGRALVPAAVLNRHGPARIYDHDYFGPSRRELVRSLRRWEEHADSLDPVLRADEAGPVRRHIASMRVAIAFFDEIGWLTPLRAQEEARV
jgi:hypothetical protein